MKKKLFCLVLAIAMVCSCFVGCAGSDVTATTAPAAQTDTSAPAPAADTAAAAPAGMAQVEKAEVEVKVEEMTYSEAPALAEKVAKGELPPVEERIPNKDNIYVETHAKTGEALEIGTYGGVLRQAAKSFGDWSCCRFTSLERPVDFLIDGSPFLNVLKDLQHNEDFTVWTMTFREGMRWSDGEPFTTEDVTFWYYMLHKNDYDGIAYWTALFQIDDEGNQHWAELEAIDDYTVTWTFWKPQYSANFTDTGDFKWCYAPQHFWADKVPDTFYQDNPYWPATGLTEEDVLANFNKIGMEYATMDKAKNTAYKPWKWYQVPAISAWVVSPEPGFNSNEGEIMKFVRNPYYWKVDAAGQQLPYLDEIWYVHVNDLDQGALMLESGEVDFVEAPINNVAAIQEVMGDNMYPHELATTSWGYAQLCFNVTHKDPQINALLTNYAFRQALSIAVDRSEVVNLWFDGLTVPQNAAPQYPNFGYKDEWAYKNCEYDPAKAKELLEKDCGLVMGADGFYDFADGRDISLVCVAGTALLDLAEQFAVLKQYWDAIGVRIDLKVTEEYNAICDSNENWDLAIDEDMLTGYRFESRPKVFVPLNFEESWYSFYDYRGSAYNPEYWDLEGDFLKIYQLYQQWLEVPELNDRKDIELEIMDIIIQGQWVLAFSSKPSTYYCARNAYGNWVDGLIYEDKFNNFMICQWWTIFERQ